jgi:hypothetical protein
LEHRLWAVFKADFALESAAPTNDDYLVAIEDESLPFEMVLAVHNAARDKWRFFLSSGTPARHLIGHFCETEELEHVPGKLNEEHDRLFLS